MARSSPKPDAKRSTEPTGGAQGGRSVRKRRLWGTRGWGSRIVGVLVLVALLLGVGWWGLKGPITRAIVLSKLEQALGTPVDAERVELRSDGSLVLSNVRIRVPTVTSEASELLSAARIEVELTIGDSGPIPKRLLIDKPRLRLSRNSENGRLNVLRLPAPQNTGSGPLLLPEIEITDGVLEFGEHDSSGYTLLKSVPLVGEVQPLPDVDAGGYSITVVTQTGVADAPSVPLRISGRIGDAGVTMRLDRVRLQEWLPESVPSQYRELIAAFGFRGDVSSVEFTAQLDGSDLETQVVLDGVRMRVPLDRWVEQRPAVDTETLPQGEGAVDGPVLAATEAQALDVLVRTGMLRVRADGLSAELSGVAAGVPVVIELDHQGLSLDAPFTLALEVNEYQLTKDPPWLAYVPAGVLRRLNSFSNPTGLVDAKFSVVRTVEGTAPRTEGTVEIRDGVAAFESFPYEVSGLSGRATITPELLLIEDISGSSPQGAVVTAIARIEPPRSGAQVAIDIDVVDAPLDDKMAEALGENRRQLLTALFHQPSYEALIREGLLEAGSDGFSFGGSADVAIRIRRELGDDSDWVRDIQVSLREIGLVPEAFPFPIIAEDVIVRLDGITAKVEDGQFRTLTGEGTAEISAEVDIAKGSDLNTELRISAHDVPLDGRLVYAVANAGAIQRGSALLASAVNRMQLSGLVDCDAILDISGEQATSDDMGYQARVTLRDLVAEPYGSTSGLQLRGIDGTIQADAKQATIQLEGRLVHNDVDAGAAALTMSVNRASQGKEQPTSFRGVIDAQQLNLKAPVEEIVRVFADDAAQTLTELREQYAPAGLASLQVHLDGSGDELAQMTVQVLGTDRAEAQTPLGRVWLTQQEGTITYTSGGSDQAARASVVFEQSAGEVGQGNQRAAVYAASGPWELGAPDVQLSDNASPLSLKLTSVDSAASLTRALLHRVLPEALDDDLEQLDPSGLLSAELQLRPSVQVPQVSGSFMPGRMEVTRGERRVVLTGQGGSLRLSPSADSTNQSDEGSSVGKFDGMRFVLGPQGEGAALSIDGGWSHTESDGGGLDLQIAAQSTSGLNDDLLAILPKPVAESLMGAQIQSSSTLVVEPTAVKVRWSQDLPVSFELRGAALVRDASAQVGVPITELDGRVEYEAASSAERVKFRIQVEADRLRFGGVQATYGRVVLTEGQNDEQALFIPELTTVMHGGRLAGTARLLYTDQLTEGMSAENERAPLRYEVDLRMAAVAFAGVLNDLNVDPVRIAQEFAPELQGGPDRTRGLMDARLGLSGVLGDRSTTSGSGSLVIGGGEVLDLPLVLPLIQVSNLEAPSNDPVDMAEATFVVQGERMQFEKLSVYTPSVEIAGHGTMQWTDRVLDLRFASRRVRRIPLISEAIERFRDELVTTKVAGSLDTPEITIDQFSGTRRILGRLFGGGDDETALQLDRARRLADAQERIRRVDDRANQFFVTPTESQRRNDGGMQ
jgi:hypothetical protein